MSPSAVRQVNRALLRISGTPFPDAVHESSGRHIRSPGGVPARLCTAPGPRRMVRGLLIRGGDQGLVTDGDPDAQPCLVQSAFEGGRADPGDLGGLLRGESFDVTQ